MQLRRELRFHENLVLLLQVIELVGDGVKKLSRYEQHFHSPVRSLFNLGPKSTVLQTITHSSTPGKP